MEEDHWSENNKFSLVLVLKPPFSSLPHSALATAQLGRPDFWREQVRSGEVAGCLLGRQSAHSAKCKMPRGCRSSPRGYTKLAIRSRTTPVASCQRPRP